MFFLFKVTDEELDNTAFIVEGSHVDEAQSALDAFCAADERSAFFGAFDTPTDALAHYWATGEIIPHNPPAKWGGALPSYAEGDRYVIQRSGGMVAKGFCTSPE